MDLQASSCTRMKEVPIKDFLYRRCCGLDVHNDTIAAFVRWIEEGGESCKESRVFGTTTQELQQLAAWMDQHLSSILRLGPLRSSNLAHLDIDILPHFVGGWFGRPGGSEAWRPGFWGAV